MDTIFPTRTNTQTVHGYDIINNVVADLIDASQWFAVMPCPDDCWAITVKEENEDLLKDILRDHRWFCCDSPLARDDNGKIVTNSLGECPFCDVAS